MYWNDIPAQVKAVAQAQVVGGAKAAIGIGGGDASVRHIAQYLSVH